MGREGFYYALAILILFCSLSFAGENVTAPFHVNGLNGINWTDTHNIGATNVNWTSVKGLDASFGSHSGINWTSLGV